MTDASRTSAVFEPSKLDKRTAFYTARNNGSSITQASKIAGVHRDTGTRWEAEARVKATQLQARGIVIATKQDIAAELTRLGLHDDSVAPRDKVNALATASKVLGYDAPTRTEQLIVHASVAQWIEAQRLAASAQSQSLPSASQPETMRLAGETAKVSVAANETAVDPPEESRADALSPSQNISNSEQK